MLKTLFLFLSLSFTISYQAFGQEPIDTVQTFKGDIVIFDDQSWAFLDDLNFDGVMNHHLNELIQSYDSLSLIQTWDHDVCYTSDRTNDLTKLQDTLWLCLLEDIDKEFKIPAPGIVTSRYGMRGGRYHNGIDIDVETGDTIVSAWSGKVRYAKFNDGGFGNLVIVRHNNGLETFYAHLDKISVLPNQEVQAGQLIGLGGNTGRSRGSHLHFEVRFYDAAMNPEQVIDFEHKKCKDENLFVHKALFEKGAKVIDMEGDEAIQATAAVAAPIKPAAPAKKYYRVRSGDTLTAIANRNRTSVSKLCQMNGINPNGVLREGRSLRVR